MEKNELQSVTRKIEQITESEMSGKYLTFFTDNQLFGVPIADVVQIAGVQQITEIPEFPHYVKGIINLRGEIIPIMDMRLRLGKVEAVYTDRTCIIITNIKDYYMGLIVDQVEEVTDISDELIAPPPTVTGSSGESYLTGIGKLTNKVVLLMDTQKILYNEKLAELDTIMIKKEGKKYV